VFRDLGVSYPHYVVEARYTLLDSWNDQIRNLVLDIITRNLDP